MYTKLKILTAMRLKMVSVMITRGDMFRSYTEECSIDVQLELCVLCDTDLSSAGDRTNATELFKHV